jgi:hypothetical protein
MLKYTFSVWGPLRFFFLTYLTGAERESWFEESGAGEESKGSRGT